MKKDEFTYGNSALYIEDKIQKRMNLILIGNFNMLALLIFVKVS